MSDTIDLLEVEPGALVQLSDGAIVEVSHNPRDGMWLYGRFKVSETDPTRVDGAEHPIFAQDIEKLVSDSSVE